MCARERYKKQLVEWFHHFNSQSVRFVHMIQKQLLETRKFAQLALFWALFSCLNSPVVQLWTRTRQRPADSGTNCPHSSVQILHHRTFAISCFDLFLYAMSNIMNHRILLDQPGMARYINDALIYLETAAANCNIPGVAPRSKMTR